MRHTVDASIPAVVVDEADVIGMLAPRVGVPARGLSIKWPLAVAARTASRSATANVKVEERSGSA